MLMFKIVLKTALKPVLKTVPILLLCVVNLTLVGCGTKGPLYIPEQRYPQGVPKDQNVPKNQSAPKDADKAVETDATKNDAPAANTGAPSSPAP